MNSDYMLPVLTSSFYGPRTESPTLSTLPAVTDLVLLATDIDVSAPPIIHGSATSLDEDGESQPIKMHKSCEKFPSHDLEQFLGAVIDINLFMVLCSKIGDQWNRQRSPSRTGSLRHWRTRFYLCWHGFRYVIISFLTPHILIIIFTGREEEKGLVTFWQVAQQQSSWLCHALREARCHPTPQTPGEGDAWGWEGTC